MLWRPLLSSATSVEPVPLVMACALCCGALLAFCAIGLRIGLQANSIGTLLAAVLVTHIAVVAASSTGAALSSVLAALLAFTAAACVKAKENTSAPQEACFSEAGAGASPQGGAEGIQDKLHLVNEQACAPDAMPMHSMGPTHHEDQFLDGKLPDDSKLAVDAQAQLASPADYILEFLARLLDGHQPSMDELHTLRTCLHSTGGNLFLPLPAATGGKVADSEMDADVEEALLTRLLGVPTHHTHTPAHVSGSQTAPLPDIPEGPEVQDLDGLTRLTPGSGFDMRKLFSALISGSIALEQGGEAAIDSHTAPDRQITLADMAPLVSRGNLQLSPPHVQPHIVVSPMSADSPAPSTLLPVMLPPHHIAAFGSTVSVSGCVVDTMTSTNSITGAAAMPSSASQHIDSHSSEDKPAPSILDSSTRGRRQASKRDLRASHDRQLPTPHSATSESVRSSDAFRPGNTLRQSVDSNSHLTTRISATADTSIQLCRAAEELFGASEERCHIHCPGCGHEIVIALQQRDSDPGPSASLTSIVCPPTPTRRGSVTRSSSSLEKFNNFTKALKKLVKPGKRGKQGRGCDALEQSAVAHTQHSASVHGPADRASGRALKGSYALYSSPLILYSSERGSAGYLVDQLDDSDSSVQHGSARSSVLSQGHAPINSPPIMLQQSKSSRLRRSSAVADEDIPDSALERVPTSVLEVVNGTHLVTTAKPLKPEAPSDVTHVPSYTSLQTLVCGAAEGNVPHERPAASLRHTSINFTTGFPKDGCDTPSLPSLEQATGSVILPDASVLPQQVMQAAVATSTAQGTSKTGPSRAPSVLQKRPSVVKPSPAILDKVEELLHHARHVPMFDMFQLAEVTSNHALSTLAFYLITDTGLTHSFNLEPVKLARFLRNVEQGYKSNPYHNATHAADVLQTLHVVLHSSGMVGTYADPLTLLACYLAAVVHDYEHLGLTNDYLIGTSHPLAVRYNDRAPMENHHLAAAFTALRVPGLNFLDTLPKSEYERMRKMMIDIVLATDMKQHFALLGQFNSQRRQNAMAQSLSGLLNTGTTMTTTSPPNNVSLLDTPSSPRITAFNPIFQTQSLSHATNSARSSNGHRGRTSLRSSAGLTGSLLGLKLSSQTCPSPHSPSGRALSRSALPSECSHLSSMIHQADSESLLGGPLLFMDKQGSVPGAMETGGWSGEPTHPNTSDEHADAGPRHFAQTPSMKRRTHGGDSGIPPPSLPLQHMMDGGYQRQSSRNSWLTTQEVRPSLFSGMFAGRTQEDSHSGPLSPIDDSERLLSLQMAFKLSDLGHTAESLDVHLRWVAALETEFFLQGDQEKAAGLPISPLFDRTKPGVTKSQVGFYEVVVLPLFKAYASSFPGAKPFLFGAHDNYKHWKRVQKAAHTSDQA